MATYLQFEVLVQLITGYLDGTNTYIDDFAKIVFFRLSSPWFWFDCITSLPWSFLDLLAYQVRQFRCTLDLGLLLLSSLAECALCGSLCHDT